MPSKWTIPASGVTGGAMGRELVGCHIEVITNSFGTAYEFQKPDGKGVAHTPFEPVLPLPPFSFPTFTSDLGGKTTANWTINVLTLTGGARRNQAQGLWSNPPTPAAKPTKPEPPDTWVAQAGPGLETDDCTTETAALSA